MSAAAASASDRRLAVDAQQVTKRYGDNTVLDHVDLAVRPGSVLALLGHNGAGKTTLVRILTTLETPDAGTASVNGFAVTTEGRGVREQIALAGQYAAVDDLLTGRDNLVLLSRLMGLGRGPARRRARRLLAEFGLVAAGDRKVATYSGGMRRRLDLAACLVTRPAVLFLDEPTTGVDPATRAELWAAVRALADGGVAVLLTTQYLEEAEQLADDVVVLDHGRVVALGTPAEISALAGRERIVAALADPADLERVAQLVRPFATAAPEVDPRKATVTFECADPLAGLAESAAALASAAVPVRSVALRAPSLEEAFMHLTDHSPRESGLAAVVAAGN